MPIRVLIADNHVILRQGLKAYLERGGIQVIGEASDGQEAVSAATKLTPDIAILDIGMPILNGIDAAREISKLLPKTKTVL